ncbi:hypothetical protein SYNTR_0307 [Candidatus Syntrophocurvum alkaliphilum]|uniref:YtxH domain-containing protein n=1 Tax=Candidatus Syntrophocurvum alkaliphilum TaxID=2293317 RepID=A0A6I6DCN8_9FIRM|nr:YtxH domain-containing protein [Candidatus Syntrophocurvum alkaliphilum]QGT98900.1 hypothetical protein SYNTR_0307 [Candidatus Syntrophocurvum alkaliphilum]
MKDYWSGFVFGAVIGAAATILYFNEEKDVKAVARQVKAKSGRAQNFVSEMGNELGDRMNKM